MFHAKVKPVDIQMLADEVVTDIGKVLANYRGTEVPEMSRDLLLETYLSYSHTVRLPRHLNRNEVQQLKQAIGAAMNNQMMLRHEKLNAHQFKNHAHTYVIVSAYLYAYELYAI